jgi:hypothetical protein
VLLHRRKHLTTLQLSVSHHHWKRLGSIWPATWRTGKSCNSPEIRGGAGTTFMLPCTPCYARVSLQYNNAPPINQRHYGVEVGGGGVYCLPFCHSVSVQMVLRQITVPSWGGTTLGPHGSAAGVGIPSGKIRGCRTPPVSPGACLPVSAPRGEEALPQHSWGRSVFDRMDLHGSSSPEPEPIKWVI